LLPVARRLRYLELPDLPPKGDIIDWLDAGGTVESLHELVESSVTPWSATEHAETASPNPTASNRPLIVATPFILPDPASIPRRQFLYDRHLIRKYISATVAPGGVGKTSLLTATTLALSTGRQLLGKWVSGPLRAWYWNGEDPREEMERRFAAACLHYGIGSGDVADRMFLDSGRETPIKVARLERGEIKVAVPTVDALEATISSNCIDVLIIDPFVETHGVAENDNPAINAVARQFAHIADATGCAVELVHHVRKGLSGQSTEFSIEDARGAGSLIAAVRHGQVINRMTKEQAQQLDIDNAGLYFSVTAGKANLVPPVEAADWYQLVDVALPNGHLGGPGDQVGVVVPWKYPNPFDDLTTADLAKVQKAIAAADWKESSQAKTWAGVAVADVLGLDVSDPAAKTKVKALLRTWIEKGALKIVRKLDESRHERPFIEVGERVEK
jgi:hypothetical protein